MLGAYGTLGTPLLYLAISANASGANNLPPLCPAT